MSGTGSEGVRAAGPSELRLFSWQPLLDPGTACDGCMRWEIQKGRWERGDPLGLQQPEGVDRALAGVASCGSRCVFYDIGGDAEEKHLDEEIGDLEEHFDMCEEAELEVATACCGRSGPQQGQPWTR